MSTTVEASDKKTEARRKGALSLNSSLSPEERSASARHAALASAKALTKKQRSQRARNAALARFAKVQPEATL